MRKPYSFSNIDLKGNSMEEKMIRSDGDVLLLLPQSPEHPTGMPLKARIPLGHPGVSHSSVPLCLSKGAPTAKGSLYDACACSITLGWPLLSAG